MTVSQTRLNNARQISESVGGQAAFARRLSSSRQQVSHIVGANPIKPIGNRLARKIEATFGYPVGWLDQTHESNAEPTGAKPFVDVPLLDGSEFTTVPAPDAPIEYVRITKSWLRRNIEPTAVEYLSLWMARGDSMSDLIRDGDTVLIDRGQSAIQTDGVYVVVLDGEIHVKRVQRGMRGAISLTCDNGVYQPIELGDEDRKRMIVLGRVTATLRIQRL